MVYFILLSSAQDNVFSNVTEAAGVHKAEVLKEASGGGSGFVMASGFEP